MKGPPAITVQLIHIFGPMKGEINEFSQDVISIGRHPSCHLRFPVDLTIVSRNHAEIMREGNKFKLVDHSSNGTYLNGKRVQEASLKDGDVLTFSEGGPKVSFLTQIRQKAYQAESNHAPQIQEMPSQEPQPVPEIKPPEPKRVVTQSASISVQPVQVPLTIQYGATIRSFRELPVTLGKSHKCNFMIEHPAIFDQHAQIFFTDDQYWIKDLTGQNLIRINAQLIKLQASLKQEDEIALSPQGPVFRFLGGGRLAEIAEPQIEQKAPSYKEEEAPKHEIPEEKPQGGVLSKFKKLWKSS